MTPEQYKIYNEIKLYQERMGKYPLASTIKKLCGKTDSTFWITFKRMRENGDVDYASDFVNGKSRKIKIT